MIKKMPIAVTNVVNMAETITEMKNGDIICRCLECPDGPCQGQEDE